MSTGWNKTILDEMRVIIINLLGNEYWLELYLAQSKEESNYKPTGKWVLAGTLAMLQAILAEL